MIIRKRFDNLLEVEYQMLSLKQILRIQRFAGTADGCFSKHRNSITTLAPEEHDM
jgi:hypothetical protein